LSTTDFSSFYIKCLTIYLQESSSLLKNYIIGLEDAWKAEKGAGRELPQISVAYLQIERANYRGAAKMFLRLQQWLAPFPDNSRGINLGKLKQDVAIVHEALLSGGADGIEGFDKSLFTKIELL